MRGVASLPYIQTKIPLELLALKEKIKIKNEHEALAVQTLRRKIKYHFT